MGTWVIGYGFVQGAAPLLRRLWGKGSAPGPSAVQFWSALLVGLPALMAVALARGAPQPGLVIVVGLAAFGIVFAMNSSIHSYMVLAYTDGDSVSLNVGLYYMANACGRLLGTLLSGWVYLQGGIQGCLWCSAFLVGLSFLTSTRLPSPPRHRIVAA